MGKLKMIDVDNHQQNAAVFKALCDPKRLAILSILREKEQCACDLISETGIAQSALSYHMKILVDSTLVDNRQCGKWMYYRISDNGAKDARTLLDGLLATK